MLENWLFILNFALLLQEENQQLQDKVQQLLQVSKFILKLIKKLM